MPKVIAALTCMTLAAAGGQAQTTNLTLLSKGAMPKMGGYRPIRATLSEEKPATLTKVPEGLAAPLYGVLPIGPEGSGRVFHIVLDEPEGKDATLYIDSNGNGDLTDDEPADWKPRKNKDAEGKEWTQYNGGAMLEIKYADTKLPAHLGMYRFDKTDPSRAALKDVVLYYCDYAYQGEVTIGGKAYKAMLTDDAASGDFRGTDNEKGSGVQLRIDVNGNGTFDRKGESFDVRQPFNIGGTTYEIADMAALQGELLARAAKWVKPSGMLVYATCSLERAEGEDRITTFLAGHPDWSVVPAGADELPAGIAPDANGFVRTLPDMLTAAGGLDGFFIARLRAPSG